MVCRNGENRWYWELFYVVTSVTNCKHTGSDHSPPVSCYLVRHYYFSTVRKVYIFIQNQMSTSFSHKFEASFLCKMPEGTNFETHWSHMVVGEGYAVQSSFVCATWCSTIPQNGVSTPVVSRTGTKVYLWGLNVSRSYDTTFFQSIRSQFCTHNMAPPFLQKMVSYDHENVYNTQSLYRCTELCSSIVEQAASVFHASWHKGTRSCAAGF